MRDERELDVPSEFASVEKAKAALSAAELSTQEALDGNLPIEQRTFFEGVKENIDGAGPWLDAKIPRRRLMAAALAVTMLTSCVPPASVGPVVIVPGGDGRATATEVSPTAVPTETQTPFPTATPTKTETPTPTATTTQTPTETPKPEFKPITLTNTDGEGITMPKFEDYNEAFTYISKNALWHIGGKSDSTRIKTCDNWNKISPKGIYSYDSIKKIPGWKPIFGGAKPERSENFFCYIVYKVEAGTLVKYEINKDNKNYAIILVDISYQPSNMRQIMGFDIPTPQP